MMHIGVRFGLVAPVDLWVLHEESETQRNMDEGEGVLAAGFEQQHTSTRLARQSVGERASCRASAHDDVVIGGRVFEHGA